jgi:hypothetical protein
LISGPAAAARGSPPIVQLSSRVGHHGFLILRQNQTRITNAIAAIDASTVMALGSICFLTILDLDREK